MVTWGNDLDDDLTIGDVDYRDTDDDNDSIPTRFEAVTPEGDPTNESPTNSDTDEDGIPNYLDTDDDNDDTPITNQLTIEENPDPNGDGNPEDAQDIDFDGVPDYLEPNTIGDGEDGIFVFNAISPNGDGANDSLVIQGLEQTASNEIRIFNRWGVEVYKAVNYNSGNKFIGRSNGRATVGERDNLPVGTYYYTLNYTLEVSGISKERAGYIYINRK